VVLASGGAVLRWVATAPEGGGAGFSKSPGNRYLAGARTTAQKGFWGGRREYFEFTVCKREVHENDPNHPWRYFPDRKIVVDRIEGLPFPFTRGFDVCTIRWLPDSSQVTFDLQGVTVSISTENL
jgi:hypothetical protein